MGSVARLHKNVVENIYHLLLELKQQLHYLQNTGPIRVLARVIISTQQTRNNGRLGQQLLTKHSAY